MRTRPLPPVAPRRLAMLAAAVLGAHLLVLQAPVGELSVLPGTAPVMALRLLDIPPAAPVLSPEAASPVHFPPVPAARVPAAPAPSEPARAEPLPAEPPAPAAPAAAPAAAIPAPPGAGPAQPSPQQASSTPAQAALAIPGPVRLRYAVTGQARHLPFSASATLSWRHDGAQYDARFEIHALLGARQQTSAGRITAGGLAPVRFSDRSRTEQAAHFDREGNRIRFSNNAPDAPLLPGAQDRLSVMLQLGAIIGGDPAHHPAGSRIVVQTAGTRDADEWVFTIIGPETLALPGGTLATIKLERAPRHENDQRVELWIAPAQDYLPVRIRLTQAGGDSADQQWQGTDRG